MTVKDMLDLYQSKINDFYKSIHEYSSVEDSESEMFYRGVVVGFRYAYIELQKYEEKGLKPCNDTCEKCTNHEEELKEYD